MPLRDPRIASIKDTRKDEYDTYKSWERPYRPEGKYLGDKFHKDSLLFQVDPPPYSADHDQDHINYYGNDTGLHAREMNADGYPYGNSPYPKNGHWQEKFFGSEIPIPDEHNEWGIQEFKSKYPPGKKENRPWYASHIYGRLDEGTMSEGGMGSIDRWYNVQDLIDRGMMDELQKPGGDDSMSDEVWQRKKIKKARYVQKNEDYGLSRQMEEDDPELFETLGLTKGDNPQYDLDKSATKKFAQQHAKKDQETAVNSVMDALRAVGGESKRALDGYSWMRGGKKKSKNG